MLADRPKTRWLIAIVIGFCLYVFGHLLAGASFKELAHMVAGEWTKIIASFYVYTIIEGAFDENFKRPSKEKS